MLWLIFGAVILIQSYFFAAWETWTVVGWLLVIAGIMFMVKPVCGCAAEPAKEDMKAKKK